MSKLDTFNVKSYDIDKIQQSVEKQHNKIPKNEL